MPAESATSRSSGSRSVAYNRELLEFSLLSLVASAVPLSLVMMMDGMSMSLASLSPAIIVRMGPDTRL